VHGGSGGLRGRQAEVAPIEGHAGALAGGSGGGGRVGEA
jgi:hypothetical protein